MEYIVQYSVLGKKPAISEWREYSTKVNADSTKEACVKFNQSHQHLGTWLILDCYGEGPSNE